VTGLLHEIGHLVLYTRFPDLARQAMQLTQNSAIPIHEAEQQVCTCHYGQIGARLMAQWNLSKSFQMLTRYQPTPQLASEEQVETGLLHIAHGYAYRQFLTPETDPAELIEATVWEQAGVTPETVENTLPAAREISVGMEKLLLK
jgi:HD-like signal output (HDOD) protein